MTTEVETIKFLPATPQKTNEMSHENQTDLNAPDMLYPIVKAQVLNSNEIPYQIDTYILSVIGNQFSNCFLLLSDGAMI